MSDTADCTPASLRALMTGLIDYAGLFPPASLPLSTAIANYARYCRDPDRWMLARFIISAARLAELIDLIEATPAEPLSFSILGRGGDDTATFLTGLEADLAAMDAFRQQYHNCVLLDVFEVRLPVGLMTAGNEGPIVDLLGMAAERLATQGPVRPFYEAPLTITDPEWSAKIATVIRAIAAHNQQQQPAGFKLRCGGVTAAAFPTPAQVAQALLACRDAAVPLKATAGLHHPVRHFSPAVMGKMHGFLNLFGAGILAQVHSLDSADVEAIIADENPAHFTFTDETFTWRHLAATTNEISQVRQNRLIAYGSCSFDEPREDLRAMGLLVD